MSADPAQWTVDTAGGRITTAIPVTSYLPVVNEPVALWWLDGTPYVIGPMTSKAGEGTVVTVAGGLVTLDTDFGTVKVPYSSTLTPSSGELWKLMWQGGGYAVSKMSTSPPTVVPLPPPAPPGQVKAHEDVFRANQSGSFRTSGGAAAWWTDQVWSADSHVGAWFYGTKIRDTIPATAVIQTVEVYAPIASVQVNAASNVAVHGDLSKGGAPSFGASYPTTLNGWTQLANTVGELLRSGGGAAGIGINHGGYLAFKSLTEDALSGAIRIRSIY
ncbi:MAG: hypothetical protein EPO52_17690 [Herbiconiux sp.]|uniref:hypothetical protein n=1 Tax=Herbiconiux sp. TaxID=1871186 RepID=UPI00121967C2|nr:hypothetical protein [Herbiconiux sp.]TAJ46366.1 MAG: hypothetical protein EPO52_17690 [Herbiconiux sp.]